MSDSLLPNRHPTCRELEEALKDLQDTIRKRHPDSIPALIHAAQLTDSAVGEKKAMEQCGPKTGS
mgnify:FL=1